MIEDGYVHIDDCIAWCKKYGLNLIIDLHKTKGFAFDNNPEENIMFEDADLRNRFTALWKNLASRYGRLTLWNSVHTLSLVNIPLDENIVYNFHFYEPFLFTHQRAGWQPLLLDISMNYPGNMEDYRNCSRKIQCFGSGLNNTEQMGAEFMDLLISEAVEAADQAGVPIYCGEYGVIDTADVDDTLLWYQDISKVFEKHGIGRAAWTYKHMDFGLTDRHYSRNLDRIIQCL